MQRPDVVFDRAYALLSSAPEQYPAMLVVGVRPYFFEAPEAGGPVVPGWAMLRCGGDMGWTIRSVAAFPEAAGRVLIPDAKRLDPKGAPVVWTLVPLTLETLARFAQANHVVGVEPLRASLKSDNDLQNYYVSSFLADYWRQQWDRERVEPRYR